MSSDADFSLATPKRVANPVDGLKKSSDSSLGKTGSNLDSDPLQATRKEAYSRPAAIATATANVSELQQGIPLAKKANSAAIEDKVVAFGVSQKGFDTAKEIVSPTAYSQSASGDKVILEGLPVATAATSDAKDLKLNADESKPFVVHESKPSLHDSQDAVALQSDFAKASLPETFDKKVMQPGIQPESQPEILKGIPMAKAVEFGGSAENVVAVAGSPKIGDTRKEIVTALADIPEGEPLPSGRAVFKAEPDLNLKPVAAEVKDFKPSQDAVKFQQEFQQGIPVAKSSELAAKADNVVAVDGGLKNGDAGKEILTVPAGTPERESLQQGQAVFNSEPIPNREVGELKNFKLNDDAGKSFAVNEGKPVLSDTKEVAVSARADFSKSVETEIPDKKGIQQEFQQGIPVAKSSEFAANADNVVALVGGQKSGDARKDLVMDSQPAAGSKAIVEGLPVAEGKPVLQARPAVMDEQNFVKNGDIVRGEPVLQGQPVLKGEAVPNDAPAAKGELVGKGQPVDQVAGVHESKPFVADNQAGQSKEGSATGNKPEQISDNVSHSDKRLDAGSAPNQLEVKQSSDAGRSKELVAGNAPVVESSNAAERSDRGDIRLADTTLDGRSATEPAETSPGKPVLNHDETAAVKTASQQPQTEPPVVGERKLASDPAPQSRVPGEIAANETQSRNDTKTLLEAAALTENKTNAEIKALAENRPAAQSDAPENRNVARETALASLSSKPTVDKPVAENAPSQMTALAKSDKADLTTNPALRPLPSIELVAKNDRPVLADSPSPSSSPAADRKKKDTEAADDFRRYPVGPGAAASVETAKPILPNVPLQLKGAVARNSVEGNVTALPVAATPLKASLLPGTTGSNSLPLSGLSPSAPPKGVVDTPHQQTLVSSIAPLTTLTNRPLTPQTQIESGVKAPLPGSVSAAFGPLSKMPDGKPITHELLGTEVAVAAIIAAAAIAKARPGDGKLAVQPNVSIVQPDTRRPDLAPNRVTDTTKWIEPGRDTNIGRDGKNEPGSLSPTKIFGDKRELIGTELVITAMIAAAAISKTRTDGRTSANQNIPHVEHSTITVTECGAPRPSRTPKADETLVPRPLKPVDKDESHQSDAKTSRLAQDKEDRGIINRGHGGDAKAPQPAQAINIVQDRSFVTREDAKRTKAMRFELPDLMITDDSFSRDLLQLDDEQPEDGLEGTAKSARSQAAPTPTAPKILTRPTCLMDKNKTLTELAEELYHDESIAWLIADLNAGRIKDTIIDGRRVVELASRQQIELPIWEDIVEFRRNRPANAVTYSLITVVTESWIDRELLNSTLKFVGQTQQPHNLVAAFS